MLIFHVKKTIYSGVKIYIDDSNTGQLTDDAVLGQIKAFLWKKCTACSKIILNYIYCVPHGEECNAHRFSFIPLIIAAAFIFIGKKKKTWQNIVAVGGCAAANVVIIIVGDCNTDWIMCIVGTVLSVVCPFVKMMISPKDESTSAEKEN